MIVNRIMRWLRGRPSTTESTAALWAKSLLGAFLFFAIFMVALPWVPHRLLPAVLPLPPLLRSSGGSALFVAGLGVWVVCLDALSRRGRGTPAPTDAPRHLVVDGLHGVIRNPIIAGELMVIWGEALWFSSLGFLSYAVLMTLYAQWVVVRAEEPALRERFGAAYESYCQRVPRWVPRLGRSPSHP
jgi:protein-S-isoprenylcysteine O-methyltransferase Ste14